jgi:serine/threonine protein kinase
MMGCELGLHMTMIGRALSHFDVTEKLGEGGMGVVYKARDTQLNRFAALKVLPPDKVANEERRRRFIQEARAASALNHPNIVTIYEISRAEDVDFIAMEFVPGKTLEHHTPRQGMRLSDALKYAVQIADALARAHGAGIVHRDLKPGNIMIGPDGVKILDFGLAKLTEISPSDPDAATLTAANFVEAPRTEEGAIVGTVSYMAPEQAEGKAVDTRADIFSFGAILYEMVTGRRAFQGANRISTLAAVMNLEPKAVSEITPAVPRELEKRISRCLRKAPERRVQHMSDLKLALEELKEESESGFSQSGAAAVPIARSRPRWLAPALGGLALLAAGSAFWTLRPRSAPARPEMKSVVLTSYAGFESQPALSPDGKQVAFVWNGEKEERTELYVKLVDAGTPVRLTDAPGSEGSPVWSPDGRFLLFVRLGREGSGYFIIPSLGGAERKIFDIPTVPSHRPSPSADWTPDGKSIVAVDTSVEPPALVQVSVDSGEKKPLLKPLAGGMGDYDPRVSPDGKWLALNRIRNVGAGDLSLMPFAEDGSAAPRKLTPEPIDIVARGLPPGPPTAARSFSRTLGPGSSSALGSTAVPRRSSSLSPGITPSLLRLRARRHGWPMRIGFLIPTCGGSA